MLSKKTLDKLNRVQAGESWSELMNPTRATERGASAQATVGDIQVLKLQVGQLLESMINVFISSGLERNSGYRDKE